MKLKELSNDSSNRLKQDHKTLNPKQVNTQLRQQNRLSKSNPRNEPSGLSKIATWGCTIVNDNYPACREMSSAAVLNGFGRGTESVLALENSFLNGIATV